MPIKARRDITCFKVVLALKSQDDFYLTPFQHMPMRIGEICCAVGPLLPKPTSFTSLERQAGLSKLYYVASGYIHAFTDEMKAMEYCKVVSGRCANFDFCVIKCIIPKDALYFVSTLNEYEICARNILPTALLAKYRKGYPVLGDK